MTECNSLADENPCAILAELEGAYRQMIMGKTPKRVRYRDDTGAEQEVDHHRIDVPSLRAEIQRYRGLCAVSKGLKPDQFCIVAG